MRRHPSKFAAVPAAPVLAVGLSACDDGEVSTETMVDEEPQDSEETPADLQGDVDAHGEDGTERVDGNLEANEDADIEFDEADS